MSDFLRAIEERGSRETIRETIEGIVRPESAASSPLHVECSPRQQTYNYSKTLPARTVKRYGLIEGIESHYYSECPEQCGHCNRIAIRRILDRDLHECQGCGAKRNLSIHHVVPRSEGGTNNEHNLMLLCRSCHDYIEDHPTNPRTRDSVSLCLARMDEAAADPTLASRDRRTP